MDVITVNNKKYDPYFILGVTKDDSLEFIHKEFRKKVKKYHPDKYTDEKQKQKYEAYFKILVESFEYIKDKRVNTHDLQINRKNSIKDTKVKKDINKDELKEFNKNFKKDKEDKKNGKKNKESKRLNNEEEYSSFKPTYYNPLTKKKFSNEEFNKIFEYNKMIQKKQEDEDRIKEKSLIHLTTDGFNAFNSAQVGSNCALVSSYNGLLITEDDLEESGVGYWSNEYSDYRISFKSSAKNPTSKLNMKKIKNDTQVDNVSKGIKNNNIKIGSGSFKNQQTHFVKNTYESLLEKEKKDKEIVLKYLDKYDENTRNKALNGELETSIKYTSILQKYIE
jgi:curved DNA-binding protein CbpA